ncbi:hypothetical protein OAH33_00400 [bacterium]|nr:hypothetical protein [bacterium]
MLFFSYHPLGQLGTLDFLMLKLPEDYLNNKNLADNKDLSRSRQLALFVTAFSGLFVIVSCLVTGQNILILFCFFSFILQSLFYECFLYRTVLLRYSYNFEYLGKLKVSLSLSRLVLSTTGLVFFGVYGYLIAESLIYLLPIFLFREYKIKNIPISPTEISGLLKLSLPFLFLSFISLVGSQIDKWLIIANNTLEVFADYTLCIFIVSAALILPAKIDSLTMQYFREFYVTRKSEKDYYYRVLAYLQFISVFLGVYTLIVVGLFEFLIGTYLIKYSNTIEYLSIIALMLPSRHIFNVITALFGLEFRQTHILFFKLCFISSLLLCFLLMEVNLLGILTIVFASTSLLVLLMSIYLIKNSLKKLRWHLLMFLVTFSLVLFLTSSFSGLALKLIGFFILLLLTQLKYSDFFKFINNKLYLR